MIDVLYVAFNRFEMTRESFAALVTNTDWREVDTLYVYDDGSQKPMYDWWLDQQRWWKEGGGYHEQTGADFVLLDGDSWRGGPVAAMAHYLDLARAIESFAKVDNDFVVCPGWLDELSRLATKYPAVDIFGIEPMLGSPVMPHDPTRGIQEAAHIGGKGLIRRRAFSHCRPAPSGPHGYFGFTEWQTKHPDIVKAWAMPDLPCFGLDQLPFEPWTSLTAEYVEKGWQRYWPPYHEAATAYWEWWHPQFLA